ncbi:MAG: zinc-ribbon domain-containing protein [Thermoplasmata archaeon]|nr:zinc-ribbon domain-containing protein [Candidatus Sysuiplasma jiujiangense]
MYCTQCGRQIEEDARFCTFCGTPVHTPGSVQQTPKSELVGPVSMSSSNISMTSLEQRPGWSRRKRAGMVIVVVVLVLIVLSSVSYFLPLFIGRSGTVQLAKGTAPYYDLQIGEAFQSNYYSLAWNVTAVEQNDTFGFGPSYLVNGVSSTGYWYQVGIAWNWPGNVNKTADTAVIYQGFHMVYQVYYPNGTSDTIGLIDLSANVNNGNSVQVGMRFSAGDVILSVHDWNTSAGASKTVNAYGASYFAGGIQKAGQGAFFTGLMTEWYRVDMNDFTISPVTYAVDGAPTSSVLVFADEWNFSGNTPVSVFHYSSGWVSVNSNLKQYTFISVTALTSRNEFVTY